jgi:hypothetical protein
MPEVDLSRVVLPDDLQRALISKVESGQFPSQEALVDPAGASVVASFVTKSEGQTGTPASRSCLLVFRGILLSEDPVDVPGSV